MSAPLCPLDALELVENPGYHKRTIPKGEVGELSKIHEELLEAYDAEEQGVGLMTLIELSDLLGAVSSFLEKHYSDIKIDDLLKMSEVTKRAFTSGRRS
jgi:hypothetical protein